MVTIKEKIYATSFTHINLNDAWLFMSFHSAVSVKVFVALIFISGGRHVEQNLRGSQPESEFPINDRSPAQASTPRSTVPVESPPLVEMESNLNKV